MQPVGSSTSEPRHPSALIVLPPSHLPIARLLYKAVRSDTNYVSVQAREIGEQSGVSRERVSEVITQLTRAGVLLRQRDRSPYLCRGSISEVRCGGKIINLSTDEEELFDSDITDSSVSRFDVARYIPKLQALIQESKPYQLKIEEPGRIERQIQALQVRLEESLKAVADFESTPAGKISATAYRKLKHLEEG